MRLFGAGPPTLWPLDLITAGAMSGISARVQPVPTETPVTEPPGERNFGTCTACADTHILYMIERNNVLHSAPASRIANILAVLTFKMRNIRLRRYFGATAVVGRSQLVLGRRSIDGNSCETLYFAF